MKQLKKELRQEEEKLKRVEMRKKKMKDQLDKAMVSSPNKKDVPKLKSEMIKKKKKIYSRRRRKRKRRKRLSQKMKS